MNDLEPLSEELQRLVTRAAPSTLPAAAKARLWERVAASASVLPPAAGAAVLAKWGFAAAALLAGTGAGVALDRFAFPPAPEVIVRTEVVKVEVPTPPPEAAPQPAPPAEKPKTKSHPPAATASSEERQLIEAARTALIKRDAAAARQALETHRGTFPRGQLAEERDSLEVQALAQLGRSDDARDAARRFVTSYPDSVFRGAVEAAVAAPGSR